MDIKKGREMAGDGRLQAQLARQAELEHVKSEFLRLAGHELRSPLTVLRGYLDMASAGSLGELPQGLGSVMPVLKAKVDEMGRLVEQMLETARLEDNRVVLAPEDFDLRQVARECASALAPLAGAEHRFKLELSSDPIMLCADRGRIAGVITNIVDNAIKYSPEGGEILIECSERRNAGTATLTVTDHGIGIDSKEQVGLFTRFGRVVNRETNHIPGTGLGLYLAREIMHMHGGDISLRSRRGTGTRVRLTLPLAGGNARPAHTTA